VTADMTPCITKLVSYIVTFGHMPLSLAGVQLPTKTRKHENVCSFVVQAHQSVSVSKLENYWGSAWLLLLMVEVHILRSRVLTLKKKVA
jgi:hypothetical protein